VAAIYAVAINHSSKSLVKVQLGFFMQKEGVFMQKRFFLCVQNAKLKTYRLLSAKRIVKIMQISKETFSEERDMIGDGVRRPVLHLLEMF
jgi:hypothetical protein